MPGILLSKKRSSLKHSLHATPLPQKGEGGSRSEDSDIKSFQLWEPRGLPGVYASAGAGGEQPEPARARGLLLPPLLQAWSWVIPPNLQNNFPLRSRQTTQKTVFKKTWPGK